MSWKYTKKAENNRCDLCAKGLTQDEILLCSDCWRDNNYFPEEVAK